MIGVAHRRKGTQFLIDLLDLGIDRRHPAAQLNFALSSLFTWRDRRAGRALWRRWLVFHGSIAGMAVFAVARTVMPNLAASVTGICAAAVGNFFIGDRLVFRTRRNMHTNGADPFQDNAAA